MTRPRAANLADGTCVFVVSIGEQPKEISIHVGCGFCTRGNSERCSIYHGECPSVQGMVRYTRKCLQAACRTPASVCVVCKTIEWVQPFRYCKL